MKNKDKYIDDLSNYRFQIMFVDKIFSLNIKNEEKTKEFLHFRIKEFSHVLRNELICKWIGLTDKVNSGNNRYLLIDKTTEVVNSTLGKILSSGIMPAYPFFILSIINYYDTFEKPLDQEISSQGYCYQALIYLYLRKQGVTNDEIDIYINFLTEVSFHLFKENKVYIPKTDFDEFLIQYKSKYNFPIEADMLLINLHNSQIFILDSFNNYHFQYEYIYFYFVAKYLAEHLENEEANVNNIICNLHKNEFAYIAIFMTHHSKSVYLLDEIILNAMTLFEKYDVATLRKEELSFFDEQINILINEVLPDKTHAPELERHNKLESQEINEETIKNEETESDKYDNDLAKEIRRSVKTVEVMGRIIKNRAGSIEKDKLINVFEEAMQVHLRLLTSFFEIIKDEKEQKDVFNFISSAINKLNESRKRKLTDAEIEKISKIIFWNINFDVVYTFISKIIKSLGSDKLSKIICEVCDRLNTPISQLVKHGVLMWNNKNLQIDEIANQLSKKEFSGIAKKIMKTLIVDHASMHEIDYKDRQRLEAKLKLPSKRLLLESIKIDEETN